MEVVEHHLFRVTRNADVEVEEDRDEDLLQALERELARRRFGPAVRLEVAETWTRRSSTAARRELEMQPRRRRCRCPGCSTCPRCGSSTTSTGPSSRTSRSCRPPTRGCREGETPKSVFATLREGDVLVHHPYHSFATSVQRFIEQAAADPHVLAIKQTLYRTSGDSPIVDALIDAAEAGKQVVVLVEIKARFDEQANISWARALERAGCHVVYGLVGLKTHCKTALVVRQEHGVLRRYCHIGTGNYNPKTARHLRGPRPAHRRPAGRRRPHRPVQHPHRLQPADRLPHADGRAARRPRRADRADRARGRARRARARPSGIQIKANSLVDEQIIDALYGASQAGVPVELLVRGICALRPGVPGLSENIRVRSIVGRFLEHSRVISLRQRRRPRSTGSAAPT